MTESTPLPPLPPPRVEDLQTTAPSRTPLLAVTIVALVAAAIMALLWLGARSSADDATKERDAAVAERDAAIGSKIDSDVALQTAKDELAAAQAAVDAATQAAGASDAPTAEELEALRDEAAELAAEVDRLADENEELAADLADAEAAATATTVAPEPEESADPTTSSTVPPTTAPPETAPDTTIAPVSADDIGEKISGLFRRSVLGGVQKECLGQVLLDELGQQRVVDAIAAESPGEDEEFVQAILDAADFCNIDPSAIFG